MKINRNQLVY